MFPKRENVNPPKRNVHVKYAAMDLAWRWVQLNAARDERRQIMKFVGWLVRSGTRHPEIVLALAKHYLVHRPRCAFAYYSPSGATREIIAMGAAADAAIAEHEKIKREEREWLKRLLP